MEEVVKKKRGRKPKIVEKSINSEKKKRGRKPKVVIDEVKIPKKRGRKPKLKYDIVEVPEEIVQPMETVILHFPIKHEKLFNFDFEDKSVIPIPYINNNNYSNLKQEEKIMLNVSLINSDLTKPNILEEINDKRKNELSLNNKKSNIIFVNLYESNKNKKMPDTSNIHCLWDTEEFKTKPVGIPMKKIEDIYYMYGNFCSKECAAAYLFDMQCENDEIWERYSMLNYLYTDNDTIKLALPRLALQKFGGIKSIEEFRCSDKSYELIMPPMLSIIPSLEEIVMNSNNSIINFVN